MTWTPVQVTPGDATKAINLNTVQANFEAMANGDTGAPKIKKQAISFNQNTLTTLSINQNVTGLPTEFFSDYFFIETGVSLTTIPICFFSWEYSDSGSDANVRYVAEIEYKSDLFNATVDRTPRITGRLKITGTATTGNGDFKGSFNVFANTIASS